jgi:Holliday junction resolvase
MTAAQSQRGRTREVKVLEHLVALGWVGVRAASGPIDVVAMAGPDANGPDGDSEASVLLVQVKSTAGSPYERFGREDRQVLLELAERCGAEAWLAYWPPNAKLRWIGSNDWPS